jgi:type I restriction enzyme, S subunit
VPIVGSTGITGYHDKAKAQGSSVVTGRSGTLGEVHYVADDFWPLNTALWVKEFKRVTLLKLRAARDLLLPRLMSGEITV